MIDKYDLPLPAEFAESAREMADDLTKFSRHTLWFLLALTCLGGFFWSTLADNPGILGRAGAAMTVIALAHSYYALRWGLMFDKVQHMLINMFSKIETDLRGLGLEDAKVIANKRVSRAVPMLVGAVQRRFLADNLLALSFSTLVWGFGDLMPTLPF